MATLKELFSRDTDIKPRTSQSFGLGSFFNFGAGGAGGSDIPSDSGSWTSSPARFFLQIKATDESPDLGTEYYLLIDATNRLLIE